MTGEGGGQRATAVHLAGFGLVPTYRRNCTLVPCGWRCFVVECNAGEKAARLLGSGRGESDIRIRTRPREVPRGTHPLRRLSHDSGTPDRMDSSCDLLLSRLRSDCSRTPRCPVRIYSPKPLLTESLSASPAGGDSCLSGQFPRRARPSRPLLQNAGT